MRLFTLTPDARDACLHSAMELLVAGGVVVIPTDTVYGIAAHPAHPAAVERIRTIKSRQASKPIPLLAADLDAVRHFGAQLCPACERLAAACWPGALTLVIPCSTGDAEGFRVPAHDWTRSLLAACGGVLRVTSANLSGAMPAVSAVAALRDVGLEADAVFDDGPSPGGTPSTVVRIAAGQLEILRAGAIGDDTIRSIVREGEP